MCFPVSPMDNLNPVEVTTHNLYFHEEASIFTIASNDQMIATGGGDNVVRLWKIDISEMKHSDYKYSTALNSSIKLEYLDDLKGHLKSVNCVRFRKNYICSCSDGGKVILWTNGISYTIREVDNIDCYELICLDNYLIVGCSNGAVELYKISFVEGFNAKLIQSIFAHTETIQGMTFNEKYNLLATLSKDRSCKLFLLEEKLEYLDKIDTMNNEKLISSGRGFFKRLCFSEDGSYLYLCCVKTNSILVISYPFRVEHYYCKIGPFNSDPIKILEKHGLLYILTRSNLYVYKNFRSLGCIENISFKSVTDAAIHNDILFVSSLDGFISSFRYSIKSDL